MGNIVHSLLLMKNVNLANMNTQKKIAAFSGPYITLTMQISLFDCNILRALAY